MTSAIVVSHLPGHGGSLLSIAALYASPDALIRLSAECGARAGGLVLVSCDGPAEPKHVPLHLRPSPFPTPCGIDASLNPEAAASLACASPDEAELRLNLSSVPTRSLAEAVVVENLEYRYGESPKWLPINGVLAAHVASLGLCGYDGSSAFISVPRHIAVANAGAASVDKELLMIEARPKWDDAKPSRFAGRLWKYHPPQSVLQRETVRLPRAALTQGLRSKITTVPLKPPFKEQFLAEWAVAARSQCPGYEKEVTALLFGPVAAAWGLLPPLIPVDETAPTAEATVTVLGACVIVCGDAGTGKSRILGRIAATMPRAAEGGVPSRGRCRHVALHALSLVQSEPGASEAKLKRILEDEIGVCTETDIRSRADYSTYDRYCVAGCATTAPITEDVRQPQREAVDDDEQSFVLVTIDDAELLLPAEASPQSKLKKDAPIKSADDGDDLEDEEGDGSLVSPLLGRLANQLLAAIHSTVVPSSTRASSRRSPPRVCWLLATKALSLLHPGLASSLPSNAVTALGLSALDPIQRRAVLQDMLRPFSPLVLPAVVEQIADGSHGMQPSDLLTLVRSAASAAVAAGPGASVGDFLPAALAEARASLSRARNVTATMPPSLSQLKASASDLASLIGCDEAIAAAQQRMRAGLLPQLRAAKMRDPASPGFPPKGLLITGPPGCGKSSLAMALARDAMDSGLANALVVAATDIISPVLGASEAAVRRVLAEARALQPCVLVIDQFHVLAGSGASTATTAGSSRAGSALSPFARLVSELSQQLDYLEWPDEALELLMGDTGNGAAGASGDEGTVEITRLSHSRYAVPLADKRIDESANEASVGPAPASFLERAAARGQSLLGARLGSEGDSISSGVTPEDLLLSSHCASVFILAVAPSLDSIAPAIIRKGRIDSEIRLARPTAHMASALLTRVFTRSPLISSPDLPSMLHASMSRLCFRCGNRLHHAMAASAPQASTVPAPKPPSSGPSLDPAWQAYLQVLAVHLQGNCRSQPSMNSAGKSRAPAKKGKEKPSPATKRIIVQKSAEEAVAPAPAAAGGQQVDDDNNSEGSELDEAAGYEEAEEESWTPARLKRFWEESAQNAIRRGMARLASSMPSSSPSAMTGAEAAPLTHVVIEPQDVESAYAALKI